MCGDEKVYVILGCCVTLSCLPLATDLDTVLDFKTHDQKLYKHTIPLYSRQTAARESCTVEVLPPHEALAGEIARNPTVRADLQRKVADGSFGRVYAENNIVRENVGEDVFPVALYVDGLPFAKRDSLLAFYTYNLVSGVRHLNAVLRRRNTCRCGCRGWCSIFALFRFFYWSLSCLVQGLYPTSGVQEEKFKPTSERAKKAGSQLGFRAFLSQVKGDWAEFAHTFGFVSWSSTHRPCLLCQTSKAEMYEFEKWSIVGAPHVLRDDASYEMECAECEVKRTVTEEQLR